MPFLVIRRRQPHYPPPIRDDGSSPVARRGVRLYDVADDQARRWRRVGHRQPWLPHFPFRDGPAEPRTFPSLVVYQPAVVQARRWRLLGHRQPWFGDLPKETPAPPQEITRPALLVSPDWQAGRLARRTSWLHLPFPYRDGPAEPRTFPALVQWEAAAFVNRRWYDLRRGSVRLLPLRREPAAAVTDRIPTWTITGQLAASQAQQRARRWRGTVSGLADWRPSPPMPWVSSRTGLSAARGQGGVRGGLSRTGIRRA